MTKDFASRVTLAGVVLVVVLLIHARSQSQELSRRIEDLIGQAQRSESSDMQTLKEEVQTLNGRTITVTTTRHADETVKEWVERHNDAVREVSGIE